MGSEQNREWANKWEEKVEIAISEVISLYQNRPSEELLQPSTSGGWSIAQCLEHLNSYGRYYLPAMESALQKAKDSGSSLSFSPGWLGHYFTQMMQPQSTRKYKAFKDHVPLADLDAPSVVAEFIQQQETLLVLLRKAKDVDLNSVRVPISIAKWLRLKLGDVFEFIIVHNERHLAQAKRNLVFSEV